MDSRNLIAGEWVTPSNGNMPIHSPSKLDEAVGMVYLSSESDVLQACDAAKRAFPQWASTTPAQRGNILLKVADLLEQRVDDIATVASSEMGKPITEMRGEVMRGVQLLRYYSAEGVRAHGNVIPSTQADVLQYSKRVPLGTVGVITPWNFPVAIPIWKIAPALICGNTVVWKPAEIASLSATLVAQAFFDAGLQPGVLNVVHGVGAVIGPALIERGGLDAISFTGSTNTGMHVAALAAARNIKYQTEMGGKNAAVVLKDADLNVSVPAILSGAFRSAGQKCTATSRVIVERAIYDEFVTRVQADVAKLHIGSALDRASYSGPVASKAQYDKVCGYVDLALKEAHVLAQAPLQVDAATGYYVAPLVVDGIGANHPLVQEEIFGPVVALIPVDNFDEAMHLTNQTVYGLSASVFTKDLTKGLRFLDETQAGMVRINLETAGVEYQAPFGGMKHSSSHTREQGQSALDFYSQLKTCAVYYG